MDCHRKQDDVVQAILIVKTWYVCKVVVVAVVVLIVVMGSLWLLVSR